VLAQRTLYCLRVIGIVEPAGKRGRAPLHVRSVGEREARASDAAEPWADWPLAH
jgi:hypothetical protein